MKQIFKNIINNPLLIKDSEIEVLVDFVEFANKKYYVEGNPICSDAIYDMISYEIEKRNKNHPILANIGFLPKKNKVKLPIHMGSMTKVKSNTNKLENWRQKYPGPYVLSEKLDGVSLLIMYSSERNIQLFTRGNGTIGQNITHLLPFFILPKFTTIGENIFIRGECIFSKKKWESLKEDEFSNARNIISGLLNTKKEKSLIKNKKLLLNMEFIAYEVINPKLEKQKSASDQFKYLKKNGFSVVAHKKCSNITKDFLEKEFQNIKENGKYEADGVIVTQDLPNKHPLSGNPKYSIAFKMDMNDTIAVTKVKEIIWTVSQWGNLIPRIHIEPVFIGVKIQYITGHNAKFIVDNKIGKGAIIKVIRSGDVIPKVMGVIEESTEELLPKKQTFAWDKNRVHIVSLEMNDTQQIKLILRFFKKLKISNCKEGLLKKLYSCGYTSYLSIMTTTPELLASCDGIGMKTATSLLDDIRKKYNSASLSEFMNASTCFGKGFSDKKLQKIVEHFPNLLEEKMSLSELENVPGFSTKTATAFLNGYDSFIEWKKSMPEKSFITRSSNKEKRKSETKIVFSGVRDKELSNLFTVVDKVSKDVKCVIVKDISSRTSKVKKARELEIPIIEINIFKKMMEKYI